MKVGLVLEGGAMRGMFTAGALFGVNFPSKQRRRVLRYNKKYLNDKRYMGFHSLFTTGNIVNKDCAFYQLPFELDIFDQDEFARAGIDFSCFRGVGVFIVSGALRTNRYRFPITKNPLETDRTLWYKARRYFAV